MVLGHWGELVRLESWASLDLLLGMDLLLVVLVEVG